VVKSIGEKLNKLKLRQWIREKKVESVKKMYCNMNAPNFIYSRGCSIFLDCENYSRPKLEKGFQIFSALAKAVVFLPL
jgi:hypothetical protein